VSKIGQRIEHRLQMCATELDVELVGESLRSTFAASILA